MPDDHEKLVADALRAQATSSGAHPHAPVPRSRQVLGVGWILLLSVLLGLAAGTVVAVITLR